MCSRHRNDHYFYAAKFNKNNFQVNGDTGIGTIDDIADERALQWYAINLMTHKVQQQGPQWKPKDTAIIFDVGEESLNITLALPAPPRSVMRSSGGAGADKGGGLVNKGLGAGRADLVKHITSVRKMVAFGHPLQLATLTFEGVGLFTARYAQYHRHLLLRNISRPLLPWVKNQSMKN